MVQLGGDGGRGTAVTEQITRIEVSSGVYGVV